MGILDGPNQTTLDFTHTSLNFGDLGPWYWQGRVYLALNHQNAGGPFYIYSQVAPAGLFPWLQETTGHPGTSFRALKSFFDEANGVIYSLITDSPTPSIPFGIPTGNLGLLKFDCTTRTYTVLDNFTLAIDPGVIVTANWYQYFLVTKIDNGDIVIGYPVFVGTHNWNSGAPPVYNNGTYTLNTRRFSAGVWGAAVAIHSFAVTTYWSSAAFCVFAPRGNTVHIVSNDDLWRVVDIPSGSTTPDSVTMWYRKLFADDSVSSEGLIGVYPEFVSTTLQVAGVGYFGHQGGGGGAGPVYAVFEDKLFFEVKYNLGVDVWESSTLDDTASLPTWNGPTTVLTAPPDSGGNRFAYQGNFQITAAGLWVVAHLLSFDGSAVTVVDRLSQSSYLETPGSWSAGSLSIDFLTPPPGQWPIADWLGSHALPDGSLTALTGYSVDSSEDFTSLWYWHASASGPLTVICDNPPDAQIRSFYQHAFPASGGSGVYAWSLTAGSFPPGLILDPASGVLSGIPESIAALVYSISAGSLPPGLTLDGATGIVSGTPLTAGTFPFTITVSDPGALFDFTIEVTDDLGATADVSCSILLLGNSASVDCSITITSTPPVSPIQPPQPISGGGPPMGGCRRNNLFDWCLWLEQRKEKRIKFPRPCSIPEEYCNLLPWDDTFGAIPPQAVPFRKVGSIVTPAAGADHLVVAMPVPLGYDGLLAGVFQYYTGQNFDPGSGDIIWRLAQNLRYLPQFGNSPFPLGTSQLPLPMTEGQILISGQTVRYFVNVPNISGNIQVGASQIVCGLLGFFWPR